MGKCTKKAKMTADVALTDVSQSYLGVRTHAKTLALQRLPSAAVAAALPPSKPDACYLELRSRRLEKPMQLQNLRNTRRSCGCRGKEAPEIGRYEELSPDSTLKEGLGIGASFGEINFDLEARERGTRESTPCSSIRAVDTTTKQTCSSAATQRVQSELHMNAPFARELEEFFAREEKSMQRHFIEKYNYDVLHDLPLPGRYEWVAVRP